MFRSLLFDKIMVRCCAAEKIISIAHHYATKRTIQPPIEYCMEYRDYGVFIEIVMYLMRKGTIKL
jgi:hypothetical protein